ncbi:MAG: hypothetical protein EOO06_18470, partial [Chitinophagaceae bacterium]
MRKTLLIAAISLAVLLLSFFGWLQYRQYSSWKIPVHPDVDMLVRVNTDDVIRHFISEYGLNFSKKIKKNSPKTEPSIKNTGIYFPGNIFIYTISSAPKSNYYSTLPVYDLEDLKLYASAKLKMVFTDSAGIAVGKSVDSSITILANNSYMAVAYSKSKTETLPQLREILGADKRLNDFPLLTKALKQQQGLISATDGMRSVEVSLHGKALHWSASIPNANKYQELFSIHQSNNPYDSTALTTASLEVNPPAGFFQNEYSVKGIQIEMDSVLKYYNGSLMLQVMPATTQVDSITSYEYDDNFEKVEKITVTTVKVPGIRLSLAAEPALLAYLQKIGIVTEQQKLNREVFPLYEVHVWHQNGILRLSTEEARTSSTPSIHSTASFAKLSMDVGKTVQSLGVDWI